MALRFITLDQLAVHCKADGDETADISQYGETAEANAERVMNRYLFVDKASLSSAIEVARADLSAARDAYDDIINDSDSTDDDKMIAESLYREGRDEAMRTVHGLVVTADIVGAILMDAAHRWTNRVDVVTGQYGAAQEVPLNSMAIYERNRYLEGTY